MGHRLVQGRSFWLLVPMFLFAQIRNTVGNSALVITTAESSSKTHGSEKALLFVF